MAKTFHLTIAKVGENLFDGEALSATFPGAEGVFTVLANHEPFVCALREGPIVIIAADGQAQRIENDGAGVAEVSKNQATVLL
ncbi:MAG: F-type H+-transporting ATPase subunit epsilon [Candidatus Parcubacteria bacterium]|jgi:F-type H+-transporting ATPase subunit epsilon|nr:F-type H+-transporting ATPase subunit epsilon [Candidatus Parcubacteria bacterium]